MNILYYRKKHSDVEVMVFEGWDNFEDIFKWSGGSFFFVGEGLPHALRYDNECAGPERLTVSTGHAFGVAVTENGEQRADPGDYILKTDANKIFVMTKEAFDLEYDPVL